MNYIQSPQVVADIQQVSNSMPGEVIGLLLARAQKKCGEKTHHLLTAFYILY
jgi:hypothetical protein